MGASKNRALANGFWIRSKKAEGAAYSPLQVLDTNSGKGDGEGILIYAAFGEGSWRRYIYLCSFRGRELEKIY
jgi:hypothetical protein